MKRTRAIQRFETLSRILSTCIAVLLLFLGSAGADAPIPLLKKGDGVDWWFVFKFNSTSFPDCGGSAKRDCIFGGKVQNYARFSQQFVYATDRALALKKGSGCVGDSVSDPIGATFDQVSIVLKALENASVVTDPKNSQVVKSGGRQDLQELVIKLGKQSDSETLSKDKLSTGVTLISKPSKLRVPPWQMVWATLDGVSLRAATWWSSSKIYTTTPSSRITCWDASLGDVEDLGAVEIAKTGQWDGKVLGLKAEKAREDWRIEVAKRNVFDIWRHEPGRSSAEVARLLDAPKRPRGIIFRR
jgi:hypothetical protein